MLKADRRVFAIIFFALIIFSGHSQSIDAMKAAADAGNPDAQFDLGYAYLFGEGVGRDDTEAVYWFFLSAEQDHMYAQYFLGALLEEGRGISQNSRRAAQYFNAAAEQGHAYAQYELGYSYLYGRGVAKDLVLAYAWLSIAYGSADEWGDRELMRKADSNRQFAALEMSPNDVIEARLMAMNFSPAKSR